MVNIFEMPNKWLGLYLKAVVDPQLAALKKIRKMQRKKEAKKRKMTTIKTTGKNGKKRKMENQNDDY